MPTPIPSVMQEEVRKLLPDLWRYGFRFLKGALKCRYGGHQIEFVLPKKPNAQIREALKRITGASEIVMDRSSYAPGWFVECKGAHIAFDRKAFNPDLLGELRRCGYSDLRRAQMSTALSHVTLPGTKSSVFLDAGCGESYDIDHAVGAGFRTAYGVDISPVCPKRYDGKQKQFVLADICENIPIKSESVTALISQAVVDLIHPSERMLFYREAFRLVKPGGQFSCYIEDLRLGWGFNIDVERVNATRAGFKMVRRYTKGFLMVKP